MIQTKFLIALFSTPPYFMLFQASEHQSGLEGRVQEAQAWEREYVSVLDYLVQSDMVLTQAITDSQLRIDPVQVCIGLLTLWCVVYLLRYSELITIMYSRERLLIETLTRYMSVMSLDNVEDFVHIFFLNFFVELLKSRFTSMTVS